MFPLYLTYINHNRYLKIHYKTAYNYTDLQRIQILISFHKTLNNKFAIQSESPPPSYFLFL